MSAKFAGEHIRCVVSGSPGADEHHILTQKSFPEFSESVWNKIPLSHGLHCEAHQKGMVYMSEKYSAIAHWLIQYGWELQEWPKRKWLHPMAQDAVKIN
jgi:hypothetical protein